MAQLVRSIVYQYKDLMDNKSDPRVKDWPLMSGPMPTFIICVTFVYLVKYLGPSLMENRKPFKLQKTLIVYNFLQVVFSCWLFYESIMGGWFTSYSFRCQPVDYSQNATALRMARGCWWYYISKFTEFMDTIFFVLRKKNDHVSTLHVTHHAVMPMSVWFGVKFTPGGHSTFFGMLNTFVHIIMYTYYMFAAMGPQYQKYLWWKKYLTAIQMVQFVLVMVHAFQLLFTDCNYPQAFVWWIGLHAVMFYFLFADFYKQAYNNKVKEAAKKEDNKATSLASNGIKKEVTQNGNGVKHDTAISNGHTATNGCSTHENGSANTKIHSSKSKSSGGFFGGFANICQMDHALLYEDDPLSSEGEGEVKPVRRRNVKT